MTRQVAVRCDSCGEVVWRASRSEPCPACGGSTDGQPKPRAAHAVKRDLKEHMAYVGPRKQVVRSRCHAKEILKSENDRMGRELRFCEPGDC